MKIAKRSNFEIFHTVEDSLLLRVLGINSILWIKNVVIAKFVKLDIFYLEFLLKGDPFTIVEVEFISKTECFAFDSILLNSIEISQGTDSNVVEESA